MPERSWREAPSVLLIYFYLERKPLESPWLAFLSVSHSAFPSVSECFYVNKLCSSLGDRSHSIWDYKDLLDHPVWPTRDSLEIKSTTIGLCQQVKKKELAKKDFSMLSWFLTYLIVLWSLPKWASKVIIMQLCLSGSLTFHVLPFIEEIYLFAKYEQWRLCSLNSPSTVPSVNGAKGSVLVCCFSSALFTKQRNQTFQPDLSKVGVRTIEHSLFAM